MAKCCLFTPKRPRSLYFDSLTCDLLWHVTLASRKSISSSSVHPHSHHLFTSTKTHAHILSFSSSSSSSTCTQWEERERERWVKRRRRRSTSGDLTIDPLLCPLFYFEEMRHHFSSPASPWIATAGEGQGDGKGTALASCPSLRISQHLLWPNSHHKHPVLRQDTRKIFSCVCEYLHFFQVSYRLALLLPLPLLHVRVVTPHEFFLSCALLVTHV